MPTHQTHKSFGNRFGIAFKMLIETPMYIWVFCWIVALLPVSASCNAVANILENKAGPWFISNFLLFASQTQWINKWKCRDRFLLSHFLGYPNPTSQFLFNSQLPCFLSSFLLMYWGAGWRGMERQAEDDSSNLDPYHSCGRPGLSRSWLCHETVLTVAEWTSDGNSLIWSVYVCLCLSLSSRSK